MASTSAPFSALDLKADSNTISRKLTTLDEIRRLKMREARQKKLASGRINQMIHESSSQQMG